MPRPLDRQRYDKLKFLGIETSTPVCSVALSCDARVVVEYTLELGSHHSERLQPMVERVLREAGLSVGDLDGVAVAAGPGSFTGLRIGMGLAKGLCRGADLAFVRVSTLAAMAFGAGVEGVPVCPMLDARRGDVYAGVYDLVAGDPISRIPDRADAVSNWVTRLPRPVTVVGDGVEAYRDVIVNALGREAYFATLGRPTAGAVALLGQARCERGEVDDMETAEPFYLRRTQAERVREARLTGDG